MRNEYIYLLLEHILQKLPLCRVEFLRDKAESNFTTLDLMTFEGVRHVRNDA